MFHTCRGIVNERSRGWSPARLVECLVSPVCAYMLVLVTMMTTIMHSISQTNAVTNKYVSTHNDNSYS